MHPDENNNNNMFNKNKKVKLLNSINRIVCNVGFFLARLRTNQIILWYVAT